MNKLTINLGKGVILQAPIKLNMTLEEWLRMTDYINSLIKLSGSEKKPLRKLKI